MSKQLDPTPWASPYHDNRSKYPEFDDAYWAPGEEYEQDRSKYE
jgi:hypothetical protein